MLLLTPLLILALAPRAGRPPKASAPPRIVHPRPLATPAQAKAIAERETGGRAISARAIPLNGATGGWEVLVHMEGMPTGWRCTIDADTRSIRRQESIPNPPISRRR